MATTVVHCQKSPYDVYIGRAVPSLGLPRSDWANPFKLRRFALLAERRACIETFREYLLSRPDLLARLPELRGKRLGCWCKRNYIDIPCHGDVLAELADKSE